MASSFADLYAEYQRDLADAGVAEELMPAVRGAFGAGAAAAVRLVAEANTAAELDALRVDLVEFIFRRRREHLAPRGTH